MELIIDIYTNARGYDEVRHEKLDESEILEALRLYFFSKGTIYCDGDYQISIDSVVTNDGLAR